MVGARGGHVGVCGDGAGVVGGHAVAWVVLEEGGEEGVVDVGSEGGRGGFCCCFWLVVGEGGIWTGFMVGWGCVMMIMMIGMFRWRRVMAGVGGVAVIGHSGFLDDDVRKFGHTVDATVGGVGRAAEVARGWEAEILDQRRMTAAGAATSVGERDVAHRGVGGAARMLGSRGGRPVDLVGCFSTRAAIQGAGPVGGAPLRSEEAHELLALQFIFRHGEGFAGGSGVVPMQSLTCSNHIYLPEC